MAQVRTSSAACNCASLREAARHVSQLYDHHLAAAGLRNTQFTILAHLKGAGPLSVNALADSLGVDRTTLARNLQPLLRRRLISAVRSGTDARSKELQLTAPGLRRFEAGASAWSSAQAQFETRLGAQKAGALRELLGSVVGIDFELPTSPLSKGDQDD
jgi:DNA-binding MarR family transcriptional regulator